MQGGGRVLLNGTRSLRDIPSCLPSFGIIPVDSRSRTSTPLHVLCLFSPSSLSVAKALASPWPYHLIIVDGDKKPPLEDCDQYLSADMPEPDLQLRLFHQVASNMMHEYWGSKCQRDGVYYPNNFQDDVNSSEDR